MIFGEIGLKRILKMKCIIEGLFKAYWEREMVVKKALKNIASQSRCVG
jgi:hypothetical protein